MASTSPSATLTGLGQPIALVFDSSGDLFVANVANGTVKEFTPGATTPSLTLNGFATPRALLFDSSGNLYVADSSNAVSKFAPGATKASLILSGVSGPDALAIDSSGDLFVANGTGNTVSEFLSGRTTASATLIGLNQPVALAFDASGDLFVANQAANTVSKFALTGTTATATLHSLNGPDGLAFDSSGDLFVANGGAGTVSEFTKGGTTPTATLNGLNQPRGLVFDSAGDLFASNVGGNTVSEFLPGATATGVTLSGLNQPYALRFDSRGDLFAANSGASTVSEFEIAHNTPVVTTSKTALNYTLNGGPQAIDSGITVSDNQHATIASATVSISSGYNSIDDVLGFSNQNGIAGNFDSALGTLTLTGTAAVDTYQAALRSITFSSTSAAASSSSRNVSFVVNDGFSASAAASRIINLPAAPVTQLAFTTQPPANITAGAEFSFTVAAEDAQGNVATSFNGSVVVALGANPGGSTLSGTTTLSATNGKAVFSGLKLNNVAAGYTLSVTTSGLSAATLGPFSVTARGVATHLVIESAPPATVSPGAAFGFTVAAEDDFGAVDTSFNGNVTAALASNPGASTLSGTLSAAASAGVATFSGLSLNNPGTYTLQASSGNLSAGVTNPLHVVGTLTINGTSSSNAVQITFIDASDFQVVLNGGPAASYSTSDANEFVYNAPAGTFSQLIFADKFNTYSATQSLATTRLVTSGFEFDANSAVNLYIYAANGQSTATVNVSAGSGSNFYVGDAALGYSYIGDPARGVYSELSGFGSETVSGAGGSTYAYVYSTSNAKFAGNPAGSSLTVAGFDLTLDDFPQVYAVGASDGTDSMTLDTDGGSFVGQPSFSYVSGTSSGASFLIGGLYAANVTAQATNPTDQAFFYSYPGNTFNGAQGTSSLAGSAAGFASFATFVSQAVGFQSLSVEESGSGTDVADLTSSGSGTFTETATASTLAIGGVAVITVDTFFDDNGTLVAVPSAANVTGSASGTDTANLYDSPGKNSLTAQGNQATLTTPVNSVSVTQFGKVNAFQQSGTSDTAQQQAIDFALQTIGNWTSV